MYYTFYCIGVCHLWVIGASQQSKVQTWDHIINQHEKNKIYRNLQEMLVKTTLKAENDGYLSRSGKDIVEYSVFRRIVAVKRRPQLWKYMKAFCLDLPAAWKTQYCVTLNVMISFQGCDGIELLDWLFDQNEGILRHEESGRHGNHHIWPIQDPNVCGTEGSRLPFIHVTNSCLLRVDSIIPWHTLWLLEGF